MMPASPARIGSEDERAIILDAFHLPGLSTPETRTEWFATSGKRVGIRIPRLRAVDIERQADALLDARREYLADRPMSEVIVAIDRVARRLLDPEEELRRTAIAGVTAASGLSIEMARLVLDGMARDWTADALRGLLAADFPDPGALDRFVDDPAGTRRVRAFGPTLITHVFSGNVPGVAVTSLIRALLVKSASLGKTAAGERVLAPLFARALADADAGIGQCVAIAHWEGGDLALEEAAFRRAEAVIMYGGTEAIASVRDRMPSGVVLHPYSHRASFGVIAREALTRASAGALAADAARAVATFDQQGCVSPHLFYVEKGGEVDPAAWAACLAGELDALSSSLPRANPTAAEASAIHQLRGEAEIAQLAGAGTVLHASNSGTDWTVIVDPDPVFEGSCLNRVVRVKPIESITEVRALVTPIANLLQTVGVAGAGQRLEALAVELGRLGASRITAIDRMPWPPPPWHHDGRPALAGLVRWTDWEEKGEE